MGRTSGHTARISAGYAGTADAVNALTAGGGPCAILLGMVRLRHRVSVVALVWLLAHVSTFAVSLAGLCCDVPETPASSAEADECCQGLAPGQMCPMHKHGAHHPSMTASSHTSPDADGCRLRSGCHPPDVMVTGLTLALGVLVDVQTVADDGAAVVTNRPESSTHPRFSFPDLPPPKA